MNKLLRNIVIGLTLAGLGTVGALASATDITACTAGAVATTRDRLFCNQSDLSYVNSAASSRLSTSVNFIAPSRGSAVGGQGLDANGSPIVGCSVQSSGGSRQKTCTGMRFHQMFIVP